jgi:hypothetical protein
VPGANPALALARALIPDLAGQAEAIGDLLQGVQELSLSGGSDPALAAVRSWRKKSTEALVVVDQFEELFTLNAPEVRARFASFLHTWTNLRAVKDPQSPTGWKLEPGPFPGWEKLPHW